MGFWKLIVKLIADNPASLCIVIGAVFVLLGFVLGWGLSALGILLIIAGILLNFVWTQR
jgi:hypothetical protein